jgi:hypothetical protein
VPAAMLDPAALFQLSGIARRIDQSPRRCSTTSATTTTAVLIDRRERSRR